MFRLQTVFLAALLVSVELAAAPFTVATVPNPRSADGGFVSDPGQVIAAADRSALNESLQTFEQETTVEIAIVILPSIGTAVPKDFAVELFNRWGIGKRGKDNGLLLLVVMDQRRWEFETGYGLEGALPDAFLKRTGENHLVPRLRQKEFARGFQETLVPIFARIRGEEHVDDVSANQVLSIPDFSGFGESAFGSFLIYFSFFYFILGSVVGIKMLITLRRLLSASESPYEKFQNIQRFLQESGAAFFLLPLPLFVILWSERSCRRLRDAPRNCDKDGSPLQKIEEERDEFFLPEGQKVEESIGSADYDVWLCPTCENVKIYSYETLHTKYSPCPGCGHKTRYYDKYEVLAKASTQSPGKGRRHYACKHCEFTDFTEYAIPRIRNDRDYGSSESSSGSSRSGSSSSSSSSSSRSRSSFGGGSSGGGGAGGSW